MAHNVMDYEIKIGDRVIFVESSWKGESGVVTGHGASERTFMVKLDSNGEEIGGFYPRRLRRIDSFSPVDFIFVYGELWAK